jgi:AraC-like DNA-binding protein
MARTDPFNVTHYWREPGMDGLSLMQADFQSQYYPPHRHQAFVIAVTELGGAVVKSRGRVEEASASALLVFNPDEPHSGGMGRSTRWRYRSLYLEQDALDSVAQGLGVEAMPYFTSNVFCDPDLISGFLALHRALQNKFDRLHEIELLISTLGRLFARHGSGRNRIEPGPRDRRRLELALDIMRSRLSAPPSLADLSGATGLTQYQLISLFKRTVGLTPHTYLTQMRLDAARRLLAQGGTIADVAVASGFYDQSALTTYFKRFYGVTPLQFAAAMRGQA